MNRIIAVMLAFAGSEGLHAQVPIPAQQLRDLFPAAASVDQFKLTTDGARTYYTTLAGDLWMFDRARGIATRIAGGSVWDLSLSPRSDAIAYTKAGENRQQHVWLLPLDPRTGLATGRERQLSQQSADVPSISPDGNWVAFARDDPSGVGQSVVIVPTGGGTDRVVAANLPASIGNIRWTPNGETLYFGVNIPVPFTCAESCITIPGGNRDEPGSIRRVAVSGGPVSVIATTGNPNPGLSPDGSRLVYTDTGRSRRLVIADASGRRLDTLALAQVPTWSGRSTLLTVASGTARRLYTLSLPDANSRLVFEGTGPTWTPAWSPDGKTITVVRRLANNCEYRIMNPDGSPRNTVNAECGFFPSWTADQRRLVYRTLANNGWPGIGALEVATGKFTQLRPPNADDMEWVVDSDAVIVAEVPTEGGARRRALISRVEFEGRSTLLRELSIENRPTWIAPLNRTTALLAQGQPVEVRLIRLDGSGEDRMLRPAPGASFRPAISRDKQWLAFTINRPGPDKTQINAIELMRLDGTARQVIELPFVPQGQTLEIVPGGKTLLVAERPGPGVVPGLYLVDVATRKSRKVLDYTLGGRPPEFVSILDGSSVLVMITQVVQPTVSAFDLSSIR